MRFWSTETYRIHARTIFCYNILQTSWRYEIVTTFVFRQILLIILISDTFSLEFVSSPPQFFLFITFSIIGFSTSSLLAMSLMAFDNLCC